MPGRLAELARISARIRSGLEKGASLGSALKSVGGAALKSPLKTTMAVGGGLMAGAAGVHQGRATRASFEPAVRDAKFGIPPRTP